LTVDDTNRIETFCRTEPSADRLPRNRPALRLR
jgi:hypothetical protein